MAETSGAKSRVARMDRAAVLGAGVMGATIAAHLANAGVRVLLLDVVPKEGGDRNRLAASALEALAKQKPAAVYLPGNLSLIEVGNLEDDLPRLKDCDWVVEVVVENMAVKKQLLGERGGPHLHADAILSCNTCGLSVNEIADALPEGLAQALPGHPLLQPGPLHAARSSSSPSRETDPAVTASAWPPSASSGWARASSTARTRPTSWPTASASSPWPTPSTHMVEMGCTVEEVDAVVGPAMGRAQERLLPHRRHGGPRHPAARGQRTATTALPDDEERDIFKMPERHARRWWRRGCSATSRSRASTRRPRGRSPRPSIYDLGEYRPSQRRSSRRSRPPRASTTRRAAAGRAREQRQGRRAGLEEPRATRSSTRPTAWGRSPTTTPTSTTPCAGASTGSSARSRCSTPSGVAEFVKRAEADGVEVPPRLRQVDRFYVRGGRQLPHPRPGHADLAGHRCAPRARVDLLLLKKGGAEVERNAGRVGGGPGRRRLLPRVPHQDERHRAATSSPWCTGP